MNSHRITPFLWFDANAKDALSFYASIIPNSSIDFEADDDGKSQTYSATLNGQRVMALNGGPHFKLNSAFSFMIECDGQEETDRLWDAITHEGSAGQCGWCKDKFGVSWQVSPIQMREHLENPDPVKSAYAWNAMRSMTKIVISDLHE